MVADLASLKTVGTKVMLMVVKSVARLVLVLVAVTDSSFILISNDHKATV